MNRYLGFVLVAVLLAGAVPVHAISRHTVVPLILKPDLELEGTEKIYVGPIMLEPSTGEEKHAVDLSAVREFERMLRKMFKRETRFTVLPPEDSLTPPTDDPVQLSADTEFWQGIGARTGAEIIVSASIDVDVLDREGYTTEEYVSPEDGKTYFRQVLVEETGFDYDILLTVTDGVTGDILHQEQITDFKERSKRKLQEFTDMFSNLYNLETRLLGVFVPRTIMSKRYLYK